MHVLCLDLEGVLVPEIWIEFAKVTGIEELKRTTRDEPDYAKLMNYRINILKKENLKLKDIQKVISGMNPLPGAKEFIQEAKSLLQVVILSDTFTEFAHPLMEQLGFPTIFCNSLKIDSDNFISGFSLRQEDGKTKAVKALKSINLKVMASGDSYNDLGMIKVADSGALFRTTDKIKADFPDIPAYTEYSQLIEHIKRFKTEF